jgi:hypothetical protein
VSKSSVYNHRGQGKLVEHPEGGFTVEEVARYAENYLRRTGEPVVADPEQAKGVAEAKAAAEARKAAAQATHWETKTQQLLGNLVPRDEFERQIAARSALFRSDMEAFCLSIPGEVVAVVGGDPTKIPDLQQFLTRRMAAVLGRYARESVFKLPDDPRDGVPNG